ncbi:MAG TPA: hypothetical protein VFF04_04090 [Candidatus Babeliales bacterium]|nr:hypothetical protein [Candidatus Babeliales bacterium]
MKKCLIVLSLIIIQPHITCLPRSAKIGLGVAGAWVGFLVHVMISHNKFQDAHRNAKYITALIKGEYIGSDNDKKVFAPTDRLLGAAGFTLIFGGIGNVLFQLGQIATDYRKASLKRAAEDVGTENVRLKTEIAALKNKLIVKTENVRLKAELATLNNKLNELEAKNPTPILT